MFSFDPEQVKKNELLKVFFYESKNNLTDTMPHLEKKSKNIVLCFSKKIECRSLNKVKLERINTCINTFADSINIFIALKEFINNYIIKVTANYISTILSMNHGKSVHVALT